MPILGLIGAACFSQTVGAQTPRFRLTPIVKLGFTPNPLVDGTLGINDEAQVVYGYVSPTDSETTAWLWLPVTDYGEPRGFHELRTLSATDAPLPNIAREINEAGDIAGQSDGIGRGLGDATVWEMDNGGEYRTPNIAQASEAFSINDDSTPKVTGRRGTTEQCQNGITTLLAFRWELTTGSGTLTNLSAASSYVHCVGYDIGLDDTVSGISQPCSDAGACASGFRGTGWETSAIALPLGSIASGSYARTNFGYGTDDTGRTVGWTFHQIEQTYDCRSEATFWEYPSDTSPVNLGSTMPSGQSGDESRAYAINNLTNAQVVGTNLTTSTGTLWERDGSWSAIDLNTEIPCCRQNLIIRQAHDINDNGWIVAWAEYDPPSGPDEQWAVLLSPYTCPEDIDFDGDVDVNDLNLVYFSNGSCTGPDGYNGDVDNDCDVDNDDFAQIIASYGDCEGGESLGSSSTEVALMWLAAGGEESLDSAAITIEDVADSLNEPTVGERIASLFSLIVD
jgi:hypothetical protein